MTIIPQPLHEFAGRQTVALVLLAATGIADAQTWRCETADGRVEYRDRECAASAAKASAGPAPAPAAQASLPQGRQARREARGAPTRVPVNKHPVSLEFTDVRIDEVMSILARFDGRRLVVDPSVAGHRIACHYRNMPWDAAVADIAARGDVDISYDDRQIMVKKR
ncbi:MAG TPA: hypothetical protein VIN75_07335 [Burkholderiaceae bacterium]